MSKLSTLSRSIAGRTAIVTGAASGMGRATAHLFAAEGANVAVLDLGTEGVAAVVEEIEKGGGRAAGWACDVGDAAQIDRVVAEVAAHFGGIDILVNNAGIVEFVGIDAETYEDVWDRTLRIDLTAHQRMIRACLPQLTRNGDGRIVNIASTEGLGATALNSSYVAAKHGVVGLTRALAVELGAKGVTVNCICPGPIHTGMTSIIPDEHKRKFARRRVPLRRYGDPEEVAHATLSFVLPAASYVNGAVLPVDGGLTAQHT
jgi:3-oxoacyl-[acyl-carrier protein] reductase